MDDLWRGEVTLLRKSAKALLVDREGDEQWVKNSQIHDDSEIYEETQLKESGELVIPTWLAEKKGWN